MIPRSQQAYKYLQMAVSMLVDLGLDERPEMFEIQRPDLIMREDDFRSNDNGVSVVTTEAQRTSLGCFYLSSMCVVSMPFAHLIGL